MIKYMAAIENIHSNCSHYFVMCTRGAIKMANFMNFGFVALWNPSMMVLGVVMLMGYYGLIKLFLNDIPGSSPVSVKQQVLFFLGVLVIYIGKGSPVYLIGHILFSVHMVEMTFVYLLAPPLLLMGIPAWAYQNMFRLKFIKNIFGFFTKPVISVLLFNALFTFYHFPAIFDYINVREDLDAITNLVLFIAAIFMWWPIVNPLPDGRSLSDLRKIGYIILNGILLTPACAYIFLSDTVLYKAFSDPAVWAVMLGFCLPTNTTLSMDLIVSQFFNILPPLQDQKFAGVLMKVLQEIIYVSFLAVVFFRWVKREKKNDPIDPLPNS